MDDVLIDAQTLATFSNLSLGGAAEFRNSICPSFLPDDLWDLLSITPEAETAEPAWQSIQQLLQESWVKRFPLEWSIQLITTIDKHSKTSQALANVERMSNQDLLKLKLPIQEVWPFQRAVMFLTVNSWRARFCPACGKRFVAAKPKSTYCSDACFEETRKGAKRAWWNQHGQALRHAKVTTKRRKKAKKG
jgi:hypothetical protein